MINCPNCNTDFPTRFCPNCGTEYQEKRLTTLSLIKDSISTIISLDKSFFRQIHLMFTNPGKIVNDYRNGFRRYYISPLRMLFIATLFLSGSFLITKGNFLGLTVIISEDTKYISQGFVIFALFLPLIILSTWITYIREKWNFAESTVLAIYNSSFWIILFSIIAIPLYYFLQDMGILFQPVFIFFILLWNTRAFKMSLWRRIVYVFINYLLFGILIAIIFISIYYFGSMIITE